MHSLKARLNNQHFHLSRVCHANRSVAKRANNVNLSKYQNTTRVSPLNAMHLLDCLARKIFPSFLKPAD